MINFDFKLLEKFIEENKGFLESANIRKIQQPSRQELIFLMRNKGENKKFYININPQFFHVCFINQRSENLRHIKLPQKPPMFCMLLRKYIENSKIRKVSQPKEERILEFYFNTLNEIGEEIELCLSIELMGKHSNVILYNYDTNIIIGCMHNIGSEKSREREVCGGLPYIYPPKRRRCDFIGLSQKLTGYANEFIDNHFAKVQYEEKLKALKNNLLVKTNGDLRKINNTLSKLKQKQKPKLDLYRKKGDLIMSNLYNAKDFQKNIEVFDYETNEIIKIDLDENKTMKENANQFYKLYNKAKVANQKNEELIIDLNERKRFLEEKKYFIENSNEIEILEELDIEEKSSKQENKSKIMELAIDGYRVYVGRNSKQNDYIVSKIGRKEDIWFHTRMCAGSHVLLRIESGQKETEKIIYKCAKLAKENSAGKNSSKVGVIYTKFRNLKKPPGANLGYVTYSGEHEIVID
jgi:predicted ribosome quality control (RQC) complex YloA/Tae2 family protein